MKNPIISKSKFLAGLQCHKLLWHYYNAKETIPEIDETTQAIFEQGHLVGEYAKKLFPDGIEVGKGIYAIPDVVKLTLDALKLHKTMFEAGFQYENAFARADILKPVTQNQWDVYEVKSSTEVKDINLFDLALQRYVYEGAGLKIHRCNLIHINNKYFRRGEIEPKELFITEDVTDKVDPLTSGISNKLNQMVQVIEDVKCPDIPIGPYCGDPYECPLREKCWNFLPKNNVFTLYRGETKAFKLLKEGIQEIANIPNDVELTRAQQIQVEAVRSAKPHIDKIEICNFFERLRYPLFLLDFETIGTAIPAYEYSKPYQQVPFQYSLHIVASPDSEPKHYEFLADNSNDPRLNILENLKALLGEEGSIVAYNAIFEKERLKESCEFYPAFKSWYEVIEKRFVDLLDPFRNFYYYHPDQKGSASIKQVLPALTGKGYENMEIADGGAASREFYRIAFSNESVEDKTKLRNSLLEYCGLDTSAMHSIIKMLQIIIK